MIHPNYEFIVITYLYVTPAETVIKSIRETTSEIAVQEAEPKGMLCSYAMFCPNIAEP